MNESLPSDIEVHDLLPDGTRYVLPRRNSALLRFVGLMVIAFGLVFDVGAMFPLFAVLNDLADPFSWVLMLAVLAVALGGVIPVLIGWALIAGHSEVLLQGDKILARECVGTFQKTWSRDRAQVRQFAVFSGDRAGGSGPLGAIQVTTDRRRPFLIAPGYPRDLLVPLAGELARQCNAESDAPLFKAGPESKAVQVVEVQPHQLQSLTAAGALHGDRLQQPAGSKIVYESYDGGLSLNVPKAGLWRGSKGLFLFALVWCGFMACFTPIWFFAAGEMPLAGLLGISAFLLLFWAVGIGMLLGAINMGTRRAGLAVVDGALMVLRTGLFGSKTRQWPSGDIAAIRVGPSGMSVNNRAIMELQIVSADGSKYGMLSSLTDEELQWIATLLRQSLDVPDGS